jgi:hypothetical protein
LSWLAGCDRYEFPASPYPRIETLPLAKVSESGALFRATISESGNEAITGHGFVWGPRQEPNLSTSEKIFLGPVAKTGNLEVQVKYGLEAGKEYFVKAFAANSKAYLIGSYDDGSGFVFWEYDPAYD